MKILKYGLFFLLIGFVSGLFYLATINRNYKIQQTILVNAPVELVFETVNDYKTWNHWAPWIVSDTAAIASSSTVTTGVDATFSWKSALGNGTVKKRASLVNKSIYELLDIEGIGTMEGVWQFKQVSDGVEITRELSGKYSFFDIFLNQNTTNSIEKIASQSLALLHAYVQNEQQKFTVESVGVATVAIDFYVYLTTTSPFNEIHTKTEELLTSLKAIIKNHQLVENGNAFNIYHHRDSVQKTVYFSTAIPIQEPLNLSDKTILVDNLSSQRVFKTVLKGNYSNLPLAWKTAYKNLELAGFKINKKSKPLEVFVTNSKEITNSAKWITEIYIPIEDEIITSN